MNPATEAKRYTTALAAAAAAAATSAANNNRPQPRRLWSGWFRPVHYSNFFELPFYI